MLKALRSGAQGPTAKILFAVLILSFVLWGVGPMLSHESKLQYAAVVGEVKIPQAQVDRMLQEGLSRIQAQSGTTPTKDVIDRILKPSLTRQLVAGALFDQESARVGMRVGEMLIKQTIAAEPGFRDEKGKFSKEKYLSLLQAVGLTESDYIGSLRQDVLHGSLRALVAAGAHPPLEIVKLAEAYAAEKRTVDAVLIPLPKPEALPAATADELNDFYTKNTERYRAPEYRSFSYILLDVAKLADAAKPSDADVRKTYDDNPANYMQPEQRDLLLLTTANKDVAEKVSAAAQTKGLEAAAKEADLELQTLKGMTKAKTMEDLADAAFKLNKGEASGALQSGPSWNVIAVANIKPATQMSFDEAKTEISARLSAEAAEKSIQDTLRSLEDTLAGGATLAEAAQKLNLTVEKIENIAQTGTKIDDSKVTDAVVLRDVLPIAFATPDGQNSAVHDIPTGMMVLHVDAVTESQIKPFEAVKAQVESGWKLTKQAELSAVKAKEALETFKAEGKLAGTSKIGPIDRAGNGRAKLPVNAVASIFGLSGGDVTTVDSPEGSWVVKLVEISRAEAKPEDIETLRNSIKQDMAQERFTNFGQALWHQYGVTVGGSKIESPVQQ